jgi:hypothetical protein
MADPALLVGYASAAAVVVRTAIVELRWWLALRGTKPAQRPAIIDALRRRHADPVGAPKFVVPRRPPERH